VTVYLLSDALLFPDPREAEPDGLLAIGGDLRPERVLLAYALGIFPWSSAGEPLMWWSPAPRATLAPGEIRVGRSLRKTIRRGRFRVSLDRAFEAVMDACALPRPGQEGTWITPELRRTFVALHRVGLAHSAEVWREDRLVGGVYGLALGAAFCGESMFAAEDDASKVGFVALAEQLRRWGFTMIDCQVESAHLRRFGAVPVEREEFLRRLADAVARPGKLGAWSLDPDLQGGPAVSPAPQDIAEGTAAAEAERTRGPPAPAPGGLLHEA